MNYSPYEIAPPGKSTHKVNLVESDYDPRIVEEDVSLQELYDNYIKPGHMLYLTQAVKKGTAYNFEKLKSENVPRKARNYAIVRSHTSFVKVTHGQKGAQLGGLKTIILSLASPVDYFKLSLDRAYQFIANGSPVEIRTRLKGTKLSKEERLKAGDPDAWPWVHDHFAHLRPDVILKSMPEGSMYLVKPVSDGRVVQFVISRPAKQMPPIDLTTRLLRVKESLKQALQQGKQIQLPAGMREAMSAAGHTDDSARTGMPRGPAMEKSIKRTGRLGGGPKVERGDA